MSRGPWPFFGLKNALPAALSRGRVMLFRQAPENSATFVISGNCRFTIVFLRKTEHLCNTPEEAARDFRGAVSLLRTNPCGGPLSLELWLYTRYGSLQFYRVTDSALVELGPDGNITGQVVTGMIPVDPVKPAKGSPSSCVSEAGLDGQAAGSSASYPAAGDQEAIRSGQEGPGRSPTSSISAAETTGSRQERSPAGLPAGASPELSAAWPSGSPAASQQPARGEREKFAVAGPPPCSLSRSAVVEGGPSSGKESPGGLL